MALVNQTLKLEITPGGVPPKLHVTEYDENMQIVAQLYQRGQYYEIPSGTTAKVEGTLAGHPFSADATVDGSNVTFELTKGMTVAAGRAWTKIKLTKDSKPVSTCGFWLDCDRAGVEAGDVIHESGFQEQISEAVDEWLEEQGISSPTIDLEETASGVEITVEDARGTPQTAVIPAIPSGGTDSQPLTSDGNGGMFWGEARYNDAVRFFLVQILRNCLMSIDQSGLIDTLDAVILGNDDGITKTDDMLTVRFLLHNSAAQLGNSIMIS